MSFLLVEFILLGLLCLYLVYYYTGPLVSFHVKFWSFFTWLLNFGIALLAPIDLYLEHQIQNNSEIGHKSFDLATWYLILYWTVYILTWTIIPLLQGWENAGDIKSLDRMQRSLMENAVVYLYMLVGGIIFLLFLLFFDIAGDMGLLTYLKCLSISFGVFLLMIIMGYAMVEIPRTLWNESEPKLFLSYLYSKIISLDDELQEAEFTLRKYISFIHKT